MSQSWGPKSKSKVWALLLPRLSPSSGWFAAHSSGHQLSHQFVSHVQNILWAPLSSGRCWELTSLRGVEGSCPPSGTFNGADGPSADGGGITSHLAFSDSCLLASLLQNAYT